MLLTSGFRDCRMAKIIKKDIVVNDEHDFDIVAVEKKKRQKRNTTRSIGAFKPKVKKCVSESHGECSSTEESIAASLADQSVNDVRKTSSVTINLAEDLDGTAEVYRHNICQYKAIVPVDDHYLAFMLQDFDIAHKVLNDEFLIIERKILKTVAGFQWLYMCPCNPARQRLIKHFPHTVTDSLDAEKSLPFEKCIHIEAVEDLINEFDVKKGDQNSVFDQATSPSPVHDDHSYDRSKPQVHFYGFEKNPTVTCVRWEENNEVTFSVVRVDYSGQTPTLRCCSCKGQCKHIKALLEQDSNTSDLTSALIKELNISPKWRSKYVPISVSKVKIPFTCPPEEQKNNRDSLRRLRKEDILHLAPPDTGSCICGDEWDREIERDEVRVFLHNDILSAKVYFRPCKNANCCETKEYDGCEHQLLNMGTYMISHTVLRDYMRQFLTQGTPISSYYKQWYWQQCDSGNIGLNESFPYNRLRYAWYSFIQLLDIDYQCGFSCCKCGENPNSVVMDGVSLGLRKTFLPWKEHITKSDKRTALDGSSHNTRVFINNQQSRQLLLKFVKEGLEFGDLMLLKQEIAKYQPALSELLCNFFDGGLFKCPDVYHELLLLLSSNYPVCGYIHFNEKLFDTLNKISDGSIISSAEDIVLLEREFPVILGLFNRLKWEIPNHLCPILKELIRKSKYPFIGKTHAISLCYEDCECRGLGCFPTLATVCHRGDYVLDDKRPKLETQCSKRHGRHPTLTPGLFTISCVHGICYGFQIMEDAESPNVPFTILRTRFNSVPKIIIYDNACNLHNYCLNRDPVFFRDSWFMVDRFHWVNHTGCHSGYNLDSYLQFSMLNTQVAEQRNSTLKKLKSMLSYMNHDNFKNHVKLFMWFRSMMSLSNLQPSLPYKDFQLFCDLTKVYTKLR